MVRRLGLTGTLRWGLRATALEMLVPGLIGAGNDKTVMCGIVGASAAGHKWKAMEAFHKFLAFAENAEEDENPVYLHAAKFVLQIISKNGIPVDNSSAPEIEHIRQFAKYLDAKSN